MGFFRALGRAIGRVVETVGDVIGSTTISDLGWKIQDRGCTGGTSPPD